MKGGRVPVAVAATAMMLAVGVVAVMALIPWTVPLVAASAGVAAALAAVMALFRT
jgi:uncharacterized membrane protein